MATFDGFDDLLVCDKCREDIEPNERFTVVARKGSQEAYHDRCAPESTRSTLYEALEKWAPKPL